MTNIRTIAGSCVWMAVAGLLMLVTLEPVSASQTVPFSAATAAAQAAA